MTTHDSQEAVAPLFDSLLTHENAEVVVVDSGSPGGPPSVPQGFTLVALPQNVGFGRACNAGADVENGAAPADFLVFLNPDVRLTGPSLTELVTQMRGRPSVGVATGPSVDATGRPQASAWGPPTSLQALWFATGWQFPALRRLLGRWFRRGAMTSAASMRTSELDVDGHVLGGAMVVRRECWEELGGFDEGYFLYWEDADFCQRARDAGWSVAVLPCTPIVHVAGTSSAAVTQEQRWAWYVEGAERFAERHRSPASTRRLLLALRLGRAFRRRS